MSKYTRGLLAVILAVVLVLPAAAFAMLPEANARSSTGMDGPIMTGKVADPDTSGRWEIWAAGHGGNKVTTQNVGRIWTDKTVKATEENEESDFLTTLSAMSSTSNSTVTVTTPLDIVMVLDASGSMDDPMGGGDSTKRIDALKSAANSFTLSIPLPSKTRVSRVSIGSTGLPLLSLRVIRPIRSAMTSTRKGNFGTTTRR